MGISDQSPQGCSICNDAGLQVAKLGLSISKSNLFCMRVGHPCLGFPSEITRGTHSTCGFNQFQSVSQRLYTVGTCITGHIPAAMTHSGNAELGFSHNTHSGVGSLHVAPPWCHTVTNFGVKYSANYNGVVHNVHENMTTNLFYHSANTSAFIFKSFKFQSVICPKRMGIIITLAASQQSNCDALNTGKTWPNTCASIYTNKS